MYTVGFIGLGNMGSGMAGNIQKATYPLVVNDVREEATAPFAARGAHVATSPAELASGSDVIFTSLPGPREVEHIALGPRGIVEGIRPGAVYIDVSTSRPSLIRHIADEFRQKRAHVFDAPVSGGRAHAAAGTLTLMVGGPAVEYDRVKPLLSAIGQKVFYAGDVGAGSVCKLVHNMIGQVITRGIAEGLMLGVKAGVEPRVLWECLRRSAIGRMGTLHEHIPAKYFPGNFELPGFSLALAAKDVALATELGREFNVPLPFATLAEQVLIQGLNRGWGNKDSMISIVLQEEMAGVQARAQGVDAAKAATFVTVRSDAEQ